MIKLLNILSEWKIKQRLHRTPTTYCVLVISFEDYSDVDGIYTSREAAEKGALAYVHELMDENEDTDLSLEQFLNTYSFADLKNNVIGYGYSYEIYENVDLIKYA